MSAGRFRVRAAERKDASLILAFIRELADYEKLGDQVSATEEKLLASLFTEPAFAEVLIAEAVADNGAMEAAGFALYFHNYSTFLGQPGIFLEDLFVRPAFRGLGIASDLPDIVVVGRNRRRFARLSRPGLNRGMLFESLGE